MCTKVDVARLKDLNIILFLNPCKKQNEEKKYNNFSLYLK